VRACNRVLREISIHQLLINTTPRRRNYNSGERSPTRLSQSEHEPLSCTRISLAVISLVSGILSLWTGGLENVRAPTRTDTHPLKSRARAQESRAAPAQQAARYGHPAPHTVHDTFILRLASASVSKTPIEIHALNANQMCDSGGMGIEGWREPQRNTSRTGAKYALHHSFHLSKSMNVPRGMLAGASRFATGNR